MSDKYQSPLGPVYLKNGVEAKVTQTGGGYSQVTLANGMHVTIPVSDIRGKRTR